jgi:hypothetical protein
MPMLERLRGEWDQLAGAMDEFHGKLESADQECDAAVHVSEEREEHVQAAQRNLASKILLLFPLDWQFLGRGVYIFSSWRAPATSGASLARVRRGKEAKASS